MFKVELTNSYSKDYDTCTHEAKMRQENHNAPIIKNIDDISSYETIYIGAPVYWDIMPEEMVTALKELDFAGKIVRPFTTHEGSGLGSIPRQIKEICIKAEVQDNLAVRGSEVRNSKGIVENWINKLN